MKHFFHLNLAAATDERLAEEATRLVNALAQVRAEQDMRAKMRTKLLEFRKGDRVKYQRYGVWHTATVIREPNGDLMVIKEDGKDVIGWVLTVSCSLLTNEGRFLAEGNKP